MVMTSPRSSREAGYNLVVLMIAITVMTAMLAAMLPLVSTEIRRDKEEELVFRGFQYVEAIRIFQNRNHRLPIKLSELVEVKPRCIRQLWKDPMTEDGMWGIILHNNDLQPLNPPPPGRQLPPGQTPPPGRTPPPGSVPNTSDPQTSDPNGLDIPKNGDVVAVGPILGVYSKSHQKSILIFYGHERYDEWRFTVDLLSGVIRSGGAAVGGGQNQLSTRWLGRPWRFGIQGGMPLPGIQNGSGPGGFQPSPPKPPKPPSRP
jgi:type II secretory pathway pseudopilin PulG